MRNTQSRDQLTPEQVMSILQEGVRILFAGQNPDKVLKKLRRVLGDAARSESVEPTAIRQLFDEVKQKEKEKTEKTGENIMKKERFIGFYHAEATPPLENVVKLIEKENWDDGGSISVQVEKSFSCRSAEATVVYSTHGVEKHYRIFPSWFASDSMTEEDLEEELEYARELEEELNGIINEFDAYNNGEIERVKNWEPANLAEGWYGYWWLEEIAK